MRNTLKQRILDISYKKGLSHIGSCLSAVDIIDEIYTKKRASDPFILSSGHAALALYVVLEKHHKIDAEMLFDKHGVHPNRDMKNRIWCSTGSLGHGFPIAVGMALANRERNVYVLVSDGEIAEGSMYEAAHVVRRYKITNLRVHVNYNEWGAYRKLFIKDILPFTEIMNDVADVHIHPTSSDYYPVLDGQDAHYKVMSEKDYQCLAKHT